MKQWSESDEDDEDSSLHRFALSLLFWTWKDSPWPWPCPTCTCPTHTFVKSWRQSLPLATPPLFRRCCPWQRVSKSLHTWTKDVKTISCESPVSSYRVHGCAMGFDGLPPDGFPLWQCVCVRCLPICPPEEWPPLFVPWVTMGGPAHSCVGLPISSTH